MSHIISLPSEFSARKANHSYPKNRINRLGVTQFLLATLLLATLSFGLSCSGDSPVQSGPVVNVPVTVTPISGPPLTSVRVLGLDSMNVDFSNTFAYFNGVLTPLFISDSGKVSVTVPAIVDSATMWIDTSITTMSLVIVRSITGDTVALGKDIFTLEALLPAPGSVTQMLTDWTTISTSLQTISQMFGGVPGVQEQISSALLSALDSLVNSSDSLSLKSVTARLTAGNPQELALLDALFGSSGIVEQSQKYAVMFQAMADSAAILTGATQNRRAVSPMVITDQYLAFSMQFYVIVREFGRTVITPTAQTYAVVTGALGVIGNIPLATIITTSLTIIDFVVNKFVISMMPAKIDSLRIELAEDTIFVGEQTNSTVMIYAANDPQAITFNDFVGQILNGLGYGSSITSPRELNRLVDLFENVANYMAGLLQAGFSNYASAHPALNLDFTLFTMPQLRWKAQIVDTKFIDLKTHTPTIINPIPGLVNWKSDPSTTGEGRIFAATVASGATVIPEPTGFAYSGGAFGEDVAGAPAVSVWSFKKMAMAIDFAPIITAGGANVLGVTAGSLDGAGKLVPEGGIRIDLVTTGGVANPASGLTDATGQFSSVITLNPMTDTVIVQVTASNTASSTTAKDTVSAATQSGTSRIAYVSFRDGRPGIWSVNPNDTSDNLKLCTVVPIESNPFPVRRIFWSKDSQWLLYSMGGFFGTGIYTTGARALNFQRTILDPRNYEIQAPNSQSWFTTNPNEFLISADGKRSSSSIRGQFLCTAAGFRTLITGTELISRAAMFISPDEQTVAYIAPCGPNITCINTLNANNMATGTPNQVAGPFDGTARIHPNIIGWTEDGTAILYARTDASVSASKTTAIRMVDKNGSSDRLIGTVTGGFGSFTFLKTRNALAFNTISNPGNNNLVYELYTLDFGGNLQNITGVQNSFIAISSSPDGTKLVYDRNKRPAPLYMFDLNTMQETLFLSDTSAHVPAWSGTMQP